MVKQYKKSLILSSLLILLPAVIGLLLWEQLPALLPTHWGMDGQVDGWQNKAMGIFLLPLILLVCHWFCLFFTWRDPGNKGRNRKVFRLVMWIMPIISLYSSTIMYSAALGYGMNLNMLATIPIGVMFIAIGNYMPKCQQNHTIGIKITWTLANEENWNRTHRFGGKCWVIGGIVLTLCAFLPGFAGIWIMIAAVFVLAFLPMFYSWRIYRRHRQQGIEYPKVYAFGSKKAARISTVFLIVLLIFVAWIMFTGEIQYTFEEDYFTVKADFYGGMTVFYDTIDSVTFLEEPVKSIKTNGFDSARLLLGGFTNEEVGYHTRYTYRSAKSCVVLRNGDSVLILNGKDAAETLALYKQLLSKTS